MKLLIYVSPKHAAANGSSVAGAVDYLITDALAADFDALGLARIAARFTVATGTVPAADVHRLACSAATDDAVLDALGVLAHTLRQASAWAARRGPGDAYVPAYITALWNKHPRALYRDLLGPDVVEAVRAVALTEDAP